MDRSLSRSKGVKEFEELYRASRDDVYAYVATCCVTASPPRTSPRSRSSARIASARASGRAAARRGRGCSASRATRRWTSCGGAAEPHRSTGSRSTRPPCRSRTRRRSVRAGWRSVPRLESLHPRERELVALKFFAGLSNAELAAVLGTSETNAGTRVHRAIHKLREACHETA